MWHELLFFYPGSRADPGKPRPPSACLNEPYCPLTGWRSHVHFSRLHLTVANASVAEAALRKGRCVDDHGPALSVYNAARRPKLPKIRKYRDISNSSELINRYDEKRRRLLKTHLDRRYIFNSSNCF